MPSCFLPLCSSVSCRNRLPRVRARRKPYRANTPFPRTPLCFFCCVVFSASFPSDSSGFVLTIFPLCDILFSEKEILSFLLQSFSPLSEKHFSAALADVLRQPLREGAKERFPGRVQELVGSGTYAEKLSVRKLCIGNFLQWIQGFQKELNNARSPSGQHSKHLCEYARIEQKHTSGCGAAGSARSLGAKGRCPILSSKKRGNARKTEEKRAFAVWPTLAKVVWPQFWPVLWELQFHKFFHLRGVDNLAERLVWDQEARSSSLRTSTKKRPFLRLKTLKNGHFFISLHNLWFRRKFWPQFDQYRTGQKTSFQCWTTPFHFSPSKLAKLNFFDKILYRFK